MQPDLFVTAPRFDGSTLKPSDDVRLRSQMAKILALFRDQRWRTLAEIAGAVDGSEAGVSARLRDFRKPKWGSYTVEVQRLQDKSGRHVYRLVLPRTE